MGAKRQIIFIDHKYWVIRKSTTAKTRDSLKHNFKAFHTVIAEEIRKVSTKKHSEKVLHIIDINNLIKIYEVA